MATRENIKGISTGTSVPLMEGGQHCALAKYKLNQTLPFRDRLGCSPNEACMALGIGRTLLYDLIAERRVEVRKLGRRTIVSVPSLLKLMAQP
jgi:hypothetical protein